MGACYSVILKLKVLDEPAAVKALQAKLGRTKEEHTEYSLEHLKKIGIGTDTLEDLLKIFFGGYDGKLNKEEKRILATHSSAFDASYGWESVMMTAFQEIAPFLRPGSSIRIYPDYDYDYGVVTREGKLEWKH